MKYVSFSGGADSTAVAIIYAEAGEEFELVFADTGAELPETLVFAHNVAKQLDVKLRVVSHGTFYQHLANFGFLLPDFQRRWCTRLLKLAPLDAYFKPRDIIGIGIRVDEVKRTESIRKNYECTVEFPLIDAGLDKNGVLTLCGEHGLVNPCYEWRSSCSCFCCPFQRIRDWKNMLERHPTLYAMCEDWENQGAHNWRPDLSLKKIRETEQAQLDLFKDNDDEPCTICRW